eukprot:357488-Chlamydomonas_euryale.AAC.7
MATSWLLCIMWVICAGSHLIRPGMGFYMHAHVTVVLSLGRAHQTCDTSRIPTNNESSCVSTAAMWSVNWESRT